MCPKVFITSPNVIGKPPIGWLYVTFVQVHCQIYGQFIPFFPFSRVGQVENIAWVLFLLKFLNHISPGICSTNNRNVVANKLRTDDPNRYGKLAHLSLYSFTRNGMNSYQRFWHDLLSYKTLGEYNRNSLVIFSSNGTWKDAC